MKKILGLLLIFSLILTTAAPVFAEETDSKDLEKAITQVKSIVTIPSEYKDFQYSKNQYQENGKSVSLWNLNWNKEGGGAGISATVQGNGYLTSYYRYSDESKEGLGNISRENALNQAKAFLAKARPDLAKDLQLEENVNRYYNSDQYSFTFKLVLNDAVVDFVNASVDVDKFTGEVSGYNLSGFSEEITKLPDQKGMIGLEEARKAYLEKIGSKLSYYSYYDYDKKSLTVFPAYGASGTISRAIDAKTGEAVDLYGGYFYGDGAGGMMEKSSYSNSAVNDALTKEELVAVEKVTNLISKEKAESILNNLVPAITSDMKVTSSNLSKSYAENEKYVWEIGFDGAYGMVNAQTGEITSFYIYKEDTSKGNGITEQQAREKAESFMKKIAGDKFEQSAFYQTSNEYIIYKDAAENPEYSFNYYRQVNGIDFIGNGFTVIVNKSSGMITHYDCNWYDGVKFPGIENVITSEAAFKIFDQTGKLSLMVKKVNNGDEFGANTLVYDFKNPIGNFLLNPVSGEKIGLDGTAYRETSLPEYTDIKGHWAEKTILKLMENGYYKEGNTFQPNGSISQIGFLRYLYSPIQAYYDDDEFYKMLINDKVVMDNEKNPKAELTRQDAAKFTVRYLGQGKSADHPEIFINPFKDKVSDSYKGYAAISYGLGIMNGDKKGRFNGTNIVTNAEAAKMIYNALQVK